MAQLSFDCLTQVTPIGLSARIPPGYSTWWRPFVGDSLMTKWDSNETSNKLSADLGRSPKIPDKVRVSGFSFWTSPFLASHPLNSIRGTNRWSQQRWKGGRWHTKPPKPKPPGSMRPLPCPWPSARPPWTRHSRHPKMRRSNGRCRRRGRPRGASPWGGNWKWIAEVTGLSIVSDQDPLVPDKHSQYVATTLFLIFWMELPLIPPWFGIEDSSSSNFGIILSF